MITESEIVRALFALRDPVEDLGELQLDSILPGESSYRVRVRGESRERVFELTPEQVAALRHHAYGFKLRMIGKTSCPYSRRGAIPSASEVLSIGWNVRRILDELRAKGEAPEDVRRTRACQAFAEIEHAAHVFGESARSIRAKFEAEALRSFVLQV